MAYVQTYDRLGVCVLNQEAHSRTCGYWYTVTSRSSALTAFARKDSLIRWASERGLVLPDDLAEPGTFQYRPIDGAFRVARHSNEAGFYANHGAFTRTMDNGEYTLALITDDADGLRTVHKMNPCVTTRPVFNYAESKELVG